MFLHYIILASISLVLAYVNYRGLDVVGKASVLIFFISMAPFFLMVCIGIPKVDTSKWLQTPTGEVEVFDDDALDQNGWFPAAFAGIACECDLCMILVWFCLVIIQSNSGKPRLLL